jgi:hypothetical protein
MAGQLGPGLINKDYREIFLRIWNNICAIGIQVKTESVLIIRYLMKENEIS